MTTKSDILTQSLIDYILDIKPFHTKFRNVTSQIFFSDKLNANVKEHYMLEAHLQNMWGRDDLGGYTLSNMSEGALADKSYILPAVIFPRFSLNDSLQWGQTPPGDDPTDQNLTDTDADGIPDVDDPWTGQKTASHQTGNDMIPVEAPIINTTQSITGQALVSGQWVVTSTILIEFHNEPELLYQFDLSNPNYLQIMINNQLWTGTYGKVGPMIQINGYTQTYASQAAYNDTIGDYQHLVPTVPIQVLYLVTGRYAVPFHQGSRIRVDGAVQTFGDDYIVDNSRGFIQFLPGRWPIPSAHIDINIFRSDRLFICKNDPFSTSDTFTIIVNSDHTCSVGFYNSEPGTNKATLQNATVNSGAFPGYAWQVTPLGHWNFSVQQISPFLSAVTYISFRQLYDDGILSFVIDRNWASYYATMSENFYSYFIEQDPNSYLTLDALPFGTELNTDPSEFIPNLALVTEHGVVNDPLAPMQAPVRFDPLGVVRKNSAGNYIFEFDTTPAAYSYIEFRVEQEGQFNPWVNASITEQINFFDLLHFYEECAANSEPWWGQYALAQYNSGSAPLVLGQQYVIESLGTTDWHGLGVPALTTPIVGLQFTSSVNAVISGTGTASEPLPINAVSSPLYPPQPVVTWYDTNLYYDNVPYDEGTYDDSSFIPHTDLNLLTGGTNTPNHPRPETEGFYPYVRDDMYLTVTFQDTATTRIHHHVTLFPNANLYQEPREINDLIIHRDGNPITSIEVYNEGLIVTPDSISFKLLGESPNIPFAIRNSTQMNVVIISFNTPTSMAVKLI